MALATRCPQCHAMFRVVADQLKLRGGLVRCGTCRHVFDAIGSLTYVDDAAAKLAPAEARGSTPRQAATADASGARGRPSAPAPPAPPAQARPRPTARPITLRIAPNSASIPTRPLANRDFPSRGDLEGAKTQPIDAGVPTLWMTDGELSLRLEPAGGSVQKKTDQARAEARKRPAKAEVRAEVRADARAELPGARRAEAAAAASTASSKDEATSDARARDRSGPSTVTSRSKRRAERKQAAADAAQSAARVDDRLQDKSERLSGPASGPPAFLAVEGQRSFPLAYALGSAALAVTIVLQLTVLFRTELVTRWPSVRPALVTACGWLGCSVGWPTRAELLAVVGTELQAVPGTDVLELTAVIRNRANFRVGLPAVEVTLTDTQNRPLARKVFAPIDYLASAGEPSSRINEGLGTGSDYTVRIVFEARGLSAVGFVVYPFYL